MKKSILLTTIFSLFLINSSNAAIFQQVSENNTNGYGAPMCFTNKSVCVVGNYMVSKSGQEQLFIKDGIVCNEKKTQCTNGSFLLTSSVPIF